jgi:hypothetical protein
MTCAKFSLLSRNFPKLCAIALLFASFPARAGDMTSTLLMGTSRIDVVIDSGDLKVSQADLMRWVQRAAEAVSTYYGRYPVPHAGIRIIPVDGNGIRHGQTFPYNGGFIKIRVGAETLVPELDGDWMLTHEMVHLAFPSVEDNHHWMEEGISVYVEPIARIQAGQMTAVQMWSDLVRDMPKGVPHPEDTGLDHTHTWASTYWGGALYCFLADVEIRRETHNKKGLQDALRGILNSGGDIRQDWKLVDALQAGDRAAGVTAMEDLYAKMKDQPMQVDLPGLWKELGIESDGSGVRLIDDAPLAAIRRAITDPQTAKAAQPTTSSQPSAVFAGRAAGASRQIDEP